MVADFSGLTRDRQYGHVRNSSTVLIDTGGISSESNDISIAVKNQAETAILEADILFFLVDVKDGLTPLDEEIASSLRKTNKKIFLVCNKAEGLNKASASEFYELGMGEPCLISAEHNQGISDLIEITIPLLPEIIDEQKQELKGIAVAVLGRPNVGKSTLINRILGEERVLAIDIPGTTRDSIFIPFEREGQQYTLIDTAGIRRKRSVNEKVEIFSIIKAKEAIDESHVVVLYIYS